MELMSLLRVVFFISAVIAEQKGIVTKRIEKNVKSQSDLFIATKLSFTPADEDSIDCRKSFIVLAS